MRGFIRTQSFGDHFQHAVHIVHNVVIPEAKDFIIVLAQPLVAYLVTRVFSVLTAIDLYNQSSLATDKVNNVSTDRLLTDELMAVD